MRQGSLTIFFSMILLSLFSLFFSMVETLRIYEMRLESRSVTKIAIANAFSEYQPYLWKTYGILALDVGYGTEDFDLAHIEKRLSDFAWENCLGSEKEHGLELFSIEPEQAEVTAYGLLTDDEGAALICQGAEVARQQILQEDYAYVKMDHMVYTMDISCSFTGQGLFDAFLPMQPLWVDLYRSECQETLYY